MSFFPHALARSLPTPFTLVALTCAVVGGCRKSEVPPPTPLAGDAAQPPGPSVAAGDPAHSTPSAPGVPAEEGRPRRGLDDGPGAETAPPALQGLFAAPTMTALPASADLAVAIDLGAVDGELAGSVAAFLRDALGLGPALVVLSPVTRDVAGLPKEGAIAACAFDDGAATALVVPLAAPDRFRALLVGDGDHPLGSFAPVEGDPAMMDVFVAESEGGIRAIVLAGSTAILLAAEGGDRRGTELVDAFRKGPRLGAHAPFARAAALAGTGVIATWLPTGDRLLGDVAVTLSQTGGGLAFALGLAPSNDVLSRVLKAGASLPAERLIGENTTFAMGLRLQPSEILRFVGALVGSDAEMVAELKVAARELAGVDLEGDVISLLSGDVGLALEGGIDPERAAESEGEAAIVASLKGIGTLGIKDPERVRGLLAKAPTMEALQGAGLTWDEAGVLSAPIPGGSIRMTLADGQLVATNDEALAARVSAAPQATPGLGDALGAISREGRAVGFVSASGALVAPALSGMVRLEEAPWPPPPVFDDAPDAQKKLEAPLNAAFEAAMVEWRASNEAARKAATELAVAAGRVAMVFELKGAGIVGTGRWTLAAGEGLDAWFGKVGNAGVAHPGEARAAYEALRADFVRAGDDGEGGR